MNWKNKEIKREQLETFFYLGKVDNLRIPDCEVCYFFNRLSRRNGRFCLLPLSCKAPPGFVYKENPPVKLLIQELNKS